MNALKPVPVAQLTTSFATIYTVPAVTKFTVSMIHLCNVTNAAVLVQVCLVPSAGSPTIANALVWDISVPANDVLELLKGDMWPADSTLQAKAASNSAVTLKVAGIETT